MPVAMLGDRRVVLSHDGLLTIFDPATLKVSTYRGEKADLSELDLSPAQPLPDEGQVLERRPAILPLLFGAGCGAAHRPRLGRLTINISNACNLACAYCYADHGLYHSPKSLMSPEYARAIVDRVTALYGRIETVQLFGGEPLMNLAAFNAIGEAFDLAVRDGRLPAMPRIVATTNGTLSGPRVVEVLKRWDVALTISWDGPDSVHDAVRPTANGKKS